MAVIIDLLEAWATWRFVVDDLKGDVNDFQQLVKKSNKWCESVILLCYRIQYSNMMKAVRASEKSIPTKVGLKEQI